MKTPGFVGLLLVAFASTAIAQQQKSAQAEVPEAQRPPKGMCRIWLRDVPASQQPAPTDCAAAVKNCPPNGRVIFGDTEEMKDREKPKLEPKGFADPKRSTPTRPPITTRKPPA